MATSYKINGSNFEDYFIYRDVFAQGGLWMWGRGDEGQLGLNLFQTSSPVQTVAAGTNWKQVSAGQLHAAAIKTDGTLWTFGRNSFGELGDNTVVNKSSPVQTVAAGTNWKQVSICGYATAAIKTDGTLWLWGNNDLGQLGDNTVVSKSSPIQTIAGGTNWKFVSAGQGYFIAAIKTDGTLWMWGTNSVGQLGDNSITAKSSPVQTVAGGTNWKQVAVGVNHTVAIKTDGTLWGWGDNWAGQLGDNTVATKSSPVQTIAGGTNWKQVSCANDNTAAIKTDGTLWLWGRNSWGQLGDNTSTDKSSPVQTVAGGTNWKQVACGTATAAIKTDGTLWGWGLNNWGQIGDNTNTTINKSSPVQNIAGGTNWKQVSMISATGGAIKDIF